MSLIFRQSSKTLFFLPLLLLGAALEWLRSRPLRFHAAVGFLLFIGLTLGMPAIETSGAGGSTGSIGLGSPAVAQQPDGGDAGFARRIYESARNFYRDDRPDEAKLKDYIDMMSVPELCWACYLYGKTSEAMDAVGRTVASSLGPGAAALLLALLGMWAMIRLVTVLGNWVGGSSLSIIQSVIFRLGVAVLVLPLLGFGVFSAFMTYVFGPIVYAGGDIADMVMTGVAGVNTGACPSAGPAWAQSAVRVMCGIHTIGGQGIGLGMFLILERTSQGFWSFNPVALIAGVSLVLVFVAYSIVVPLKLLDSVARFVLVALIFPVLVVAAFFDVSRQSARNGVNALVQGALALVFIAASAAIVMGLLQPWIVKIVEVGEGDSTLVGIAPWTVIDFVLIISIAVGGIAMAGAGNRVAAEIASSSVASGAGEAASSGLVKIGAGAVALPFAGVGGAVIAARAAGGAMRRIGGKR